MNKNIYGFHHICLINNGIDILFDQINSIKASGLYLASNKIFCSVLGRIPSGFTFPYKYETVYTSTDTSSYERKILEYMYLFSKENTGNFWYVHTKGVTRNSNVVLNANIKIWRKYLEYFVIERFEDCIKYLENYDVVGVNYRCIPKSHFSGNFWWTTSDYVKTNPPDFDYNYYYETEMWICKNTTKTFELFNTNNVGYQVSCSKSEYMDDLLS